MPGADEPFRHLLADNGPRADNGPATNGDAGVDERFRADPGVIPNVNRAGDEFETGGAVVMRAGAEMRPLGNHGTGADGDGGLVVKDDAVADANFFPTAEVPRRPDSDGRIDVAAGAELRPKAAEEKGAPGVAGAG